MLDTPIVTRTEGDEGIHSVLYSEHGRRIFHRLTLDINGTLTDRCDGQTIVYLLIHHSHLIVLIDIGNGIFAKSGFLRCQRVGSIDVSKQTVADDGIIHRHIHNLIALIRDEGHYQGVTLHKGVLNGVVPDDERVVDQRIGHVHQRVTLTDGLTVSLRQNGDLKFTTDDLIELSGPALFIHKGSSGTLGHLQRSLLIDTLKHAQVYLERFLEFYLYPPQTVTILEGSLLNFLHSSRKFQ